MNKKLELEGIVVSILPRGPDIYQIEHPNHNSQDSSGLHKHATEISMLTKEGICKAYFPSDISPTHIQSFIKQKVQYIITYSPQKRSDGTNPRRYDLEMKSSANNQYLRIVMDSFEIDEKFIP